LEYKKTEKEKGKIDYLFIEAALLIECGYNAHVDEMWYIYTKEEVRRERLKSSRGYSDEKIDSIMAAQLSEEDFKKGSDKCIDNSAGFENTVKQIRKLLG
ncbi:MAG: dephospho-CoA kinase, partial [Lachnospiraceae bacterium]|nr:dephospho-CoA kinase [Lachnospiraceae bacterium]